MSEDFSVRRAAVEEFIAAKDEWGAVHELMAIWANCKADRSTCLWVAEKAAQLGQHSFALDAWRYLLTADPNDLAVLIPMLWTRLFLARPGFEALALLSEINAVFARKTLDCEQALSLGGLYQRLGARKKAVEAAERAVRLQPDDVRPRQVLARALLDDGQPRTALRELRKLFASHSELPAAVFQQLGRLAALCGDQSLAVQFARKQAEANPANLGCTLFLVRELIAARQGKEAGFLLAAALDRRSATPLPRDVYLEAINIFGQIGDRERERTLLKEALERFPADEGVRAACALVSFTSR